MKKLLIATALLGLVAGGDAFAWGRGHHAFRHGYGHHQVGVGVVVGAPFWTPWYYPAYHPPIIIERQAPPVYIERLPEERVMQAGYWYYCQSPSGYYPEIRECPGAWIKVPPRP
jgi:hypothetical protein